MRVLLVEPNYKNKYPPMGLMKISTYHKILGDEVRFVKGFDNSVDMKFGIEFILLHCLRLILIWI